MNSVWWAWGTGADGGDGVEWPLVRRLLGGLPDSAMIADLGGATESGAALLEQYPAVERFASVDVYDVREPVRMTPGMEWRKADLGYADLHVDRQYDAVLLISVIEHMHSSIYGNAGARGADRVAVQNGLRMLASGGTMLVTTTISAEPADPAEWVHYYGVAEIEELAALGGGRVSWYLSTTDGWYECESAEEYRERCRYRVAEVDIAAIMYSGKHESE